MKRNPGPVWRTGWGGSSVVMTITQPISSGCGSSLCSLKAVQRPNRQSSFLFDSLRFAFFSKSEQCFCELRINRVCIILGLLQVQDLNFHKRYGVALLLIHGKLLWTSSQSLSLDSPHQTCRAWQSPAGRETTGLYEDLSIVLPKQSELK